MNDTNAENIDLLSHYTFPMTKEEHDTALEKLGDELQEQQLLYLDSENLLCDEDKDAEYHQWMEKQLRLIKSLISIYNALKEYKPGENA